MLDTFARLLVLSAFAAFCAIALARESTGAKLLNDLRSELTGVRSLPRGERPAPPDHDLKGLIGVARAEVLKVLGVPSSCEPKESQACTDSPAWSYVWGPEPRGPQVQGDSIVVQTGGPWLLVIEFRHGQVASAHWQGQR